LLEQARFVDELKSERGMDIAEIAQQLSRSKAWVSLRLGLVAQLSSTVREALFAGAFPVYSYLYSLRPFRRLNPPADIDQFVNSIWFGPMHPSQPPAAGQPPTHHKGPFQWGCAIS
jgi:hypothetical protein